MKRLASADNLLIATLWQRMLESAGIRCEVRNRYLNGAVGELPASEAAPQIWLVDERDEPRACLLLDEWQRPAPLPGWTCPRCDERMEGQFFQCWRCGATQS